MNAWAEYLGERAARRRLLGLQRTLFVREADTPLIDLASNDYLGLSAHPQVALAAQRAAQEWGAGARSSRLVSGTTQLHHELEAALAEFTGHPAALVFSSGYTANLGVITALADADTTVISDQHIHASLIDACRLTKATRVVTPHNDVPSVEQALSKSSTSRHLIVVESIYSVLSDAAPLQELAALAQHYNALLIVDEAHGVGVTPPNGRGVAAAAGLAGHPHVVLTATLSKALGAQGGAVLGSPEVIDHLVNQARSFIFDTALAPPAVAAARTALSLVTPPVVANLRARIKQAAQQLTLPTPAGAVLSVPMPSAESAIAAQAACRDAGVWVGCFRPPSVPDGVSRLRITVNSGLAEVSWQHALDVIAEVVNSRHNNGIAQ
jgi:8-amino-7-oxononanoate synthase